MLLCTIHATSAAKAISHLAAYVLQSNVELPYRAIRTSIAEAVDLVIHLARDKGNRLVTELLRIEHYDTLEDRFEFEPLYQRGSNGA